MQFGEVYKDIISLIVAHKKHIDNQPKVQRVFFYLGCLFFCISLGFGFLTRIGIAFQYIQFDYDQARDALIVNDLHSGTFTGYGPTSSIKGYHLPPIYYYLLFGVSFFSSSPVVQALVNGVLEFLSIPLFVCIIYRLLSKISKFQSFFIASVAGFWWSCFFQDIFHSNKAWNPSSIPFFLFALIIVYDRILELRMNTNRKQLTLLWILYGVILSILIGLHSTTLFILPAIYIGHFLYFGIKTKHWAVSLIPLFIIGISLTPYFYQETFSSWKNTRDMFSTLTGIGQGNSNIFIRLNRALEILLSTATADYWPNFRIQTLARFSFAAIIGIALFGFRGKKDLFHQVISYWGVFIIAASGYTGVVEPHYRILLWPVGIFMSAAIIGSLRWTKFNHLVVGLGIIGIMLTSIGLNVYQNYKYVGLKYGQERIMNTRDWEEALNTIPEDSTICIKPGSLPVIKYISKVRLKKNINWQITNCQKGHYIIISAFRYNKHLDLVPNSDWKIIGRPVLTNSQYKILILEEPIVYATSVPI